VRFAVVRCGQACDAGTYNRYIATGVCFHVCGGIGWCKDRVGGDAVLSPRRQIPGP
jgi:hypothetical protein